MIIVYTRDAKLPDWLTMFAKDEDYTNGIDKWTCIVTVPEDFKASHNLAEKIAQDHTEDFNRHMIVTDFGMEQKWRVWVCFKECIRYDTLATH